MFSIDGLTWDIHCEIERVAEIKPSEISGMLLDRSWFNDVLGTYLRYEITIDVPLIKQDRYAEIYEALSAPVDAHTFILPYNSGTVTITGRVERIEDNRREIPGGRKYWADTRFTVVSSAPTRAMTLSQVLTRGRSPLPEVAEATIGDAYTYTANGWQPSPVYADADDTQY